MQDIATATRDRIGRFRAVVGELGLDGLALFSRPNIRYLTGFSGSVAQLVLSERDLILIVDGRYTTQAAGETSGCAVIEGREPLPALADAVRSRGLKSLGFEAAAISVADFQVLKARLTDVELKPLTDELALLRARKDSDEISILAEAAELSAAALADVLGRMRPGQTERELALDLDMEMRRRGAEKASFDVIVAGGPRAALPHAKPTDRPLGRGELVLIDYGAVLKGYCADETVTIARGPLPDEDRRIYHIVKEAHDRAIEAIRPGAIIKAVDGVARQVIDSAGFGPAFSHGTGHGVGLAVHEPPRLSQNGEGTLEEGMVVTVEPGIYLPGRLGVRIEDMVLVEKDGCRLLTKTSKELRMIDI